MTGEARQNRYFEVRKHLPSEAIALRLMERARITLVAIETLGYPLFKA